MRTSDFYNFMIKREQLRLTKESGAHWPWTNDEVLKTFKFTNVKRAHDRTTKWFWEWRLDVYQRSPAHIKLFNCAVFRYFGTQEFNEAIGWLDNFDKGTQDRIKLTAKKRLELKERVFTGAYVITNGGIAKPKQDVVVDHYLAPFWDHAKRLTRLAKDTRSWEQVAMSMRRLPGFGGSGFMTKEVLQDFMHTDVVNKWVDRNTYCPIGPGARRGLNRVMGREKDFRQPEKVFLQELITLYELSPMHWPATYVSLELHDIQFQLCEFDKYERVKLGQGRPRSKYRRPT